MQTGKLLVANRGEIAIRIFRTAAERGIPTIAIFPADDAANLHTRKADTAVELPGRGVAAYLDIEAVIAAARSAGATAIHPGYGFLAENAAFAARCAGSGLVFVGPSPETLAQFGDKHAARSLAASLGIPVLPGTASPTTLEAARDFLARLGEGGAVMVKAVAGGGGRGMRPVTDQSDLEEAFTRCRSEALSGFGNGDLFVERLVRRARHIEVQIVGDGHEVSHLWERDCSLQRRRQKLVEMAPAPNLDPALRARLIDDALKLGKAAGYKSLGTVEFLLDTASGEHFFIEANPRLQVEHTVTEEVTGLDLVELQLRIAQGATLAELGLRRDEVPPPRGAAVQVRVNTETVAGDGTVKPAAGVISAFEPPSGRGVRIDGCGYAGYRTSPAYDSLIAKVIVHSAAGGIPDALAKAYRALCEFRIEGVATNLAFLQALLASEAVRAGTADTGFVEAEAAALASAAGHRHLYFAAARPGDASGVGRQAARAGAKVDAVDPLAVLAYGQGQRPGDSASQAPDASAPPPTGCSPCGHRCRAPSSRSPSLRARPSRAAPSSRSWKR